MAENNPPPPPGSPVDPPATARAPQRGDLVNPFSLSYGPPVFTYAMLGLIVLIFFVTISAGLVGNQGQVLYQFGASFGPNIIQGEIWRLFTAMFLHADVTHILFNGFALYVLGPDMERLYGFRRYSLIYLLSGLYGSVASFALNGPAEFSVGASGAIFGIIGMQLAFFTFYRGKLGKFGQARFQGMLRLVIINLILGFVFVRINSTAHIGGLIAGFLLGYLLKPEHIVTRVTFSGVEFEDRGKLSRTWWIAFLAAAGLIASMTSALIFWQNLTT